jgi:DUF4097 and DUF4098 domain-containing protein YvlB
MSVETRRAMRPRRGRAAVGAALALLALAAAAAPAAAQESRYYREGRHYIHEIAGAIPAAAPAIRVATDLGAVEFVGARAPGVRYRIRVRAAVAGDAEARRRLDELAISISRSGDALVFKGEAARPMIGRGLSAEFDLTVPAATPEIEVTTGAGEIRARGLEGRVTLATRGGRIAADALGGPLQAETRGGPIEVGSVAGTARLVTAGGRVRVDSAGGELLARSSGGEVAIGRAGGQVRAETGGGSVRIDSAAGDVEVATSGGNIELGRVEGKVVAATAGGSIRVSSAARGIRCETAAGPIVLRGLGGPVRAVTSAGSIQADLAGAAALADSDLQTWSGDVTLILSETLPLTIRALIDNPIGHRIQSDFPLKIFRDAENAGRPMEIAEGSIGGGGSLLKVRTLGGNILILKAKNAKP